MECGNVSNLSNVLEYRAGDVPPLEKLGGWLALRRPFRGWGLYIIFTPCTQKNRHRQSDSHSGKPSGNT